MKKTGPFAGAISLCFVTCSLLVSPAHAQPGELDSSFGTSGYVTTQFHPDVFSTFKSRSTGKDVPFRRSSSCTGHYVAVQSDGAFLVAGTDSIGMEVQSRRGVVVARYVGDGSLDPGFGLGGKVSYSSGDNCGDTSKGLAVLQDGKVFVVAGSSVPGPVKGKSLRPVTALRYNPNGTPDSSYGDAGVKSLDIPTPDRERFTLEACAIQPDGRVVVAGTFFDDSTKKRSVAVQKFGEDGSADKSFGDNGMIRDDLGGTRLVVTSTCVQPDGKVLIGGWSFRGEFTFNPATRPNVYAAVVRFHADGRFDEGFGNGGKVAVSMGTPHASEIGLSLPGDGTIVVGVKCSTHTNAATSFGIIKLGPDGRPVSGFGKNGNVVTYLPGLKGVTGIVTQPDGRIVSVGHTHKAFVLVRHLADGSLDWKFGKQGFVTLEPMLDLAPGKKVDPNKQIGVTSRSVTLQPDGNLLIIGSIPVRSRLSVSNHLGLARVIGQ